MWGQVRHPSFTRVHCTLEDAAVEQTGCRAGAPLLSPQSDQHAVGDMQGMGARAELEPWYRRGVRGRSVVTVCESRRQWRGVLL